MTSPYDPSFAHEPGVSKPTAKKSNTGFPGVNLSGVNLSGAGFSADLPARQSQRMSKAQRSGMDAMRLSDSDRNDAMNQLARAVGEGRLSIEEFEERSDDVMAARFRRDLVPVFQDIPVAPLHELKEFSRGDLERMHQDGQNRRLGVALLTTLFSGGAGFLFLLGGATVGNPVVGVGLGVLSMLLIPTVWIALYVMKVGPAEWYAPSMKQLEKEERRQRRAEITQAGVDLTGEAINLARNRISKWNGGRM